MKKFLGIVLVLLVALLFVGCQGNNNEETARMQEFADPMTEDILIAINNKDYEGFSKNLSDTMKAQLTQEIFTAQILPIQDVIGTYQEGSKEMVSAEEVDKNYNKVIYNAKYSEEEGNVIITITFNTDEDNRKIEGFFMNSAKMQKM